MINYATLHHRVFLKCLRIYLFTLCLSMPVHFFIFHIYSVAVFCLALFLFGSLLSLLTVVLAASRQWVTHVYFYFDGKVYSINSLMELRREHLFCPAKYGVLTPMYGYRVCLLNIQQIKNLAHA